MSQWDNRAHTLIAKVFNLNNNPNAYFHYDSKKGILHVKGQGLYHYRPTNYIDINRGRPIREGVLKN